MSVYSSCSGLRKERGAQRASLLLCRKAATLTTHWRKAAQNTIFELFWLKEGKGGPACVAVAMPKSRNPHDPLEESSSEHALAPEAKAAAPSPPHASPTGAVEVVASAGSSSDSSPSSVAPASFATTNPTACGSSRPAEPVEPPARGRCRWCWRKVSQHASGRDQHEFWNETCLQWQYHLLQGYDWKTAGIYAGQLKSNRLAERQAREASEKGSTPMASVGRSETAVTLLPRQEVKKDKDKKTKKEKNSDGKGNVERKESKGKTERRGKADSAEGPHVVPKAKKKKNKKAKKEREPTPSPVRAWLKRQANMSSEDSSDGSPGNGGHPAGSRPRTRLSHLGRHGPG